MEKTNQKAFCFIVAFALAIIAAGCVAPHMAGGVENQQSQDIELGNGMVLHVQTERS